jgi:DNA mismatch repair protein MutS
MAAKRRGETPMMRQFHELKRQAGDALLLFRMGDFYELFERDAEIAAPALDLVLTTRDKDTEDPVAMCGVPYHAAEGYIRKLLAEGFSVAIAEQTEDPRQAKGLVRREITEVVTPGLVANPDRLSGAQANYLAALLVDGERYGLAFADVSTGELRCTETARPEVIEAELDRLAARELLTRDVDKPLHGRARSIQVPDADFDPRGVLERVGRLPEGLDAAASDAAARATAALWARIAALQPQALDQLGGVRAYVAADHLLVDAPTRRHLELFANQTDGGREGTLIELLDRTRTPMGKRRLTRWIGEPLLDLERIRARQDALAGWLEPDRRRRALASALRGVGDLERLSTRACLPSGGPRELVGLRSSLRGVVVVAAESPLDDTLADLREQLEHGLVEEPPPPPRGEPYTGYIADGVDAEVDAIRSAAEEGDAFFAALEARERERTGIAKLRVKYNRVFGYPIEVSKAQAENVPADYRRKQTIANAERYVTDELERWEGIVLRSRESAAAAEARALEKLRGQVRARSERLRELADRLAELDVLQSLAEVARERDYVRPELDAGLRIEIEQGRHPVVETFVRDGFVPNDVSLDAEGQALIVLTGPNMAGKSTLLRQVGLSVLLAQMGAWVPARRARIGLCDRIFTRVGASDSLATGESTFMVEMRETATILREATQRSLILLDEIGRGTSTFDGLSIAWAVAEYLHDAPGLRPRALFATHYHELADLAETKSGVRNFHFSCAEREGDVVFLRQMEPGAASRSYGIEVARHAGLPPDVIRRAREVLSNLERGEFDERGEPRLARGPGGGPTQLGLFEAQAHPALAALRSLEPDAMTPIEALVELARLRELLELD